MIVISPYDYGQGRVWKLPRLETLDAEGLAKVFWTDVNRNFSAQQAAVESTSGSLPTLPDLNGGMKVRLWSERREQKLSMTSNYVQDLSM